jgi:hypothetical protein
MDSDFHRVSEIRPRVSIAAINLSKCCVQVGDSTPDCVVKFDPLFGNINLLFGDLLPPSRSRAARGYSAPYS